jgi:rubrerythrin
MPDREKVIKDLEFCVNGHYKVELSLATKILALLKEQEAVVAHWDDDTGHWIEGDRNGIDPHTRTTGEMIDTFRCSWCGFYQYWKTPFCPNCGAKMKGR